MSLLPIGPDHFDAVLFDLDGVLTDSASLHAKSWKQLFDGFLRRRDGDGFRPFDADADYRGFVDGKPRHDGIRSFLASRGISLPEGAAGDTSDETVYGLGQQKNGLFLKALDEEGIATFPAALTFLEDVREAGFKTALVSSSRNSRAIVDKVGLTDRFDAWLDGEDVLISGLNGKPEPDMFLTAAQKLDIEPGRAVVVEDAIAGVQAGVRGLFGLVIGVDRTHHPEALAAAGAHLVVSRLSDVPIALHGALPIDDLPPALPAIAGILTGSRAKRLAVCLDYDGTLTPIVDRPELALLSDRMRRILDRLSDVATVAIISGRDLVDLRRLVSLDQLFYAGSHGFEVGGPTLSDAPAEHGTEYLPALDAAEQALRSRLAGIDGVLVERKHLSVAVHYRLVAEDDRAQVKEITDQVVETHSELRRTLGKMVYDLQPDIDWHKGKAVRALLGTLDLNHDDVLAIYIGDDITDEDAFLELRDTGIGIVVKGAKRSTWASFSAADTNEVADLLEAIFEHANERLGNSA